MVFMVWIVCFQHWFGLDCNLYEREMVYIELGTDTSDKFGRTVLITRVNKKLISVINC